MAVDDTGDAISQGIRKHGINLKLLKYWPEGLIVNHKLHIKNSFWVNIFTLTLGIGPAYLINRIFTYFMLFCYPKHYEPTQYQWWLCPVMHPFIIVLRNINLWKKTCNMLENKDTVFLSCLYIYTIFVDINHNLSILYSSVIDLTLYPRKLVHWFKYFVLLDVILNLSNFIRFLSYEYKTFSLSPCCVLSIWWRYHIQVHTWPSSIQLSSYKLLSIAWRSLMQHLAHTKSSRHSTISSLIIAPST